ncbi:MAG: diguanylate cyclase [Thermoanaerobaculaceae bacterium]|jgi:two-component system cell cycle response regulator|nr:diguanylate cyclase [Thermoanaerobaculaceae bacterium]
MNREPRKCHVLVVDDEPANRDLLCRRLQRAGYGTSSAASAEEAWRLIGERLPSLVLLDVCMPGVSGLDLLARLRGQTSTRLLPIIMVTSMSDSSDVVNAIQGGANDYVTKPIDLPVLLARMETHLRMASLVTQLESQGRILAHLAAFDDLTGLYNRRSVGAAIQAGCQRAQERHHPLALLMLDLDHFKEVNDRHGHAVGDAVLKELAARLAAAVRDSDVVGRHGGEEFVVMLPDTDARAALAVAERIRGAIGGTPFACNSGPIPVTVSIGASALAAGESVVPCQLLEEADRALYEAKRAGRDRVVLFGQG